VHYHTLTTFNKLSLSLDFSSMLDFLDDEPSLLIRIDHIEWMTNLREHFESIHMNCFTRVCHFYRLALIIGHHANTTLMRSSYENVFSFQSSSLYDDSS
jgi:hypothetical protein